jgi:hypothetical protein
MECIVITENITVVKLKATEGMTLTNGDVYCKEVYLGCNDTAKNWQEITDEEYERIQSELENAQKNELGGDFIELDNHSDIDK